MGVVAEDGKFVGQTLTTPETLKAFFDLQLPDRDHWRDRLWERVDAGELSEDEALDLIIKGTDDNLVTAGEEVAGVVRWPVLRIINGELVSAEFGPLSSYTDLSKPDGRLALKQAQALVKYFEQSGGPRQIFYAFSDQACGCFGVMMNYKPDTGEIMAVSKYYPMGIVELGKVFERLNSGGREVVMVGGEEANGLLGWQIRIDKEQDFISLEEQGRVIEMVMGDSVTEIVMPEFKNPSVWLGWGAGVGVNVHLGSVHEEVTEEVADSVVAEGASMTEVPKYEAPVVFSEPHPRGGVEVVAEKIVAPMVTRVIPVNGVIEDTVSHLRGVIKAEVSESTEEVMAPQVTLPRYDDVHLGSVHEPKEEVITEGTDEVTEVTHLRVSGFAQSASAADLRAERLGGQAEILVPAVSEATVMELPRYEVGELPESVVQPHPRGGVETVVFSAIKEARVIPVNGVIEDTVSHLRGVIKAEVSESTEEVMAPQVTLPRYDDVHLGSVHEPKEEVITESTRLQAPGALATGGQAELAEGTEELESRKRKFGVFNYDSVVSVIKETFDKKLAEHKSVKSVKEKIAWLQRQIANVVADQLIGRNTDEPVLGWLVHGWAMMQFDGIEEKQKMKRFSLSPVRIWADRVTGVARRVKDKFVRTGFSVYKQLFAAI